MKAIIIGAGPAGVTAAYELATKTDIKPIIYEQDSQVGGLSQTKEFKGNKIDLGPHRFFSKSPKVLNFWKTILGKEFIEVNRLTRIYYNRSFFNYPISLSLDTIKKLGIIKMFKIGITYLKASLFPLKTEETLENFYINRFGWELYATFFKDYTHKLWGVPASEISSEWGAQRVKGVSIRKVIQHALRGSSETSLIERFLFPRLGAGQMYEEIAKKAQEEGAQINLRCRCVGLICKGERIVAAKIKNLDTGEVWEEKADFFFSTMPVKEVIAGLDCSVPRAVCEIARGLVYRDFVLVGLLAKELNSGVLQDNWLYIQEKGIKMGRLDLVNNFSKAMLTNPDCMWLGCEYFCTIGDEFWNKSDRALCEFATKELVNMELLKAADIIDGVVFRVKKAYPAYVGTYKDFNQLKGFLDKFANLFLIGRNGMHKYNNMDHSVLTAIIAVENIINNVKAKDNIWAVNTEQEYYEEK